MDHKQHLSRVLYERGLYRLSQKALRGHYDDLESPAAEPLAELLSDLEATGDTELIERARNGEFDSVYD
jgi:hypothetical protein